jgi:hypothetical protein
MHHHVGYIVALKLLNGRLCLLISPTWLLAMKNNFDAPMPQLVLVINNLESIT